MGNSSSSSTKNNPAQHHRRKYALPSAIRRTTVACTTKANGPIVRIQVAHKAERATSFPNEVMLKDVVALYEIDALDLKVHRTLSSGTTHDIHTDAVWATIPRALNGRAAKSLLADRRQRILTKRENGVLFHELKLHVYLSTRFSELARTDKTFATQLQYMPRIQELQHPHILRLFGHFMQNRMLHILTEYCPHGNLTAVLDFDERYERKHDQRLPIFQEARALMDSVRQLCSGVVFLHESRVAHTNLSPGNVFVSDLGHILVGDFKEAVLINPQTRPVVLPATERHGFAAPERYLGGGGADTKVDLFKADAWSVGTLIFAMATRRRLFACASRDDLDFQRFQQLGFAEYYEAWKTEGPQRNEVRMALPDEIKMLLNELLVVSPSKRCNLKDLTQRFEWLQPGELVSEMDMAQWKLTT